MAEACSLAISSSAPTASGLFCVSESSSLSSQAGSEKVALVSKKRKADTPRAVMNVADA
jgi:hypothetical protein